MFKPRSDSDGDAEDGEDLIRERKLASGWKALGTKDQLASGRRVYVEGYGEGTMQTDDLDGLLNDPTRQQELKEHLEAGKILLQPKQANKSGVKQVEPVRSPKQPLAPRR